MREYVGELYLRESRRVYSTLVRLLGEFDLAEEAMQEAFAAALESWQLREQRHGGDSAYHRTLWIASSHVTR